MRNPLWFDEIINRITFACTASDTDIMKAENEKMPDPQA